MKPLAQLPASTAIVLVVFIVAWCVLAYFHLPIPMWMVGAGAAISHLIMALMSNGSGDTTPTNNTNAPPGS